MNSSSTAIALSNAIIEKIASTTYTLPTGGTWNWVLMDVGGETSVTVGTNSGGTTISHTQQATLLIAIRIA